VCLCGSVAKNQMVYLPTQSLQFHIHICGRAAPALIHYLRQTPSNRNQWKGIHPRCLSACDSPKNSSDSPRPIDDAGTHRIQVNVGQAVDQCLAVLHDHAFKPIAPEITFPTMSFVVKALEINFDFTHKFRQAGQLLPDHRQLPIAHYRLIFSICPTRFRASMAQPLWIPT
jgi:hypothetical protein